MPRKDLLNSTMFKHKCKLPSCGIDFESVEQFRIGCCKKHSLEYNKLTVQHGKRKARTKVSGFSSPKSGWRGIGPEQVVKPSHKK